MGKVIISLSRLAIAFDAQYLGAIRPLAVINRGESKSICTSRTNFGRRTAAGATIVRCGDLTFKLFECEPNAWIGNADAPAISFSEGFDFLDSAIVLVSPGPHNRQFVFEHDAR